MSGPVAIGPQAELAVARVTIRALHEQVAEANVTADRRARAAAADGYARGFRAGRAAWFIASLAGFAVGSALTVTAFALWAQ